MNRLISRTVKWIAALAAVALVCGACSGDDDPAVLALDSDTLFIGELGQTATVGFTGVSLKSISTAGVPAGWKIDADLATQTVTVTAPAELGGAEKAVRSGTVTLIAYSYENNVLNAKLFVSVSAKKDLTAEQANSIIVSEPYTEYTFDATRRGETSEQMATADARVIWQTAENLIKHAQFHDGKFSFYIDGSGDAITGGNALVGAYDAAGSLLTTWHLWVVDAAKVEEQTYANGKTFMSLNLGARGNTNATRGEILDSFGLFYQWGRKTPFVGPYAYDAAKAEDAELFDAAGNELKLEYAASSPETGTEAYAAANPLSFILGVAESGYDWLYAAHSDGLWAETKTADDPCPKGWRVPTKEELAGLQIVDRAAGREGLYGWNLTDGTATAYYPGAGFRPYLTGCIQNVYNPLSGVAVPKPWIGYYWSSAAEGSQASAMFFWFDAADAANSGIEASVVQYRANGMQVRCVKE